MESSMKHNQNASETKGGQKPSKQAMTRLIFLIIVTMTVFAVYRFLMGFPHFEIVMAVYMILGTGFLLAYVIYNRGMSRKGITVDMLPAEWSAEEKTEFVENGKRRQERSRWLLIPIFAFFFTFAMDILELFVLPFFTNLLTK